MKKLIVCILSLASFNTVSAQKWSAGIRTGIERTNVDLHSYDLKAPDYLWSNQIFVHRQLTRRFSAEVNLSHTSTGKIWSLYVSPFHSNLVAEQSSTTNLHIGLAARYIYLTHRRTDLFVQAGTAQQLAFHNYGSTALSGAPLHSELDYNYKDHTFTAFQRLSAGTGINYYPNRFLVLHAIAQLHYKTDGAIQMTGTARDSWEAGIHIGAGLRF